MISWSKYLGGGQLPLGYLTDVAIWKFRRRLGKWNLPNVSFGKPSNAVLIHEADSLCLTQTFPFYYYRAEIEKRFNIRLSFQLKNDFLTHPELALKNATLVLLQSWYTTSHSVLNELLHAARSLNPSAKIVFLDAMSPTDLRLAHVLGDKIDLYVKKHVLRDRSLYGKPTRGDTNLTDFYMKQYGISAPEVIHEIPKNFLRKIIIGPSFFTGPRFLGHFKFNPQANHSNKSIDVHARMTYSTTGWYGVMRGEAKQKVEQIGGIKTLAEPNATQMQFYSELRESKLCFSPFGHGEGCFRDYEAAYGGALLVKPDMSHIETNPDIFIPHETYAPVDWRFNDLEPVVRHYLLHENERRKLVNNAYKVLHEYCFADQFLDQMKPLFECS